MNILFLGASKRYELLSLFNRYGNLYSMENDTNLHSISKIATIITGPSFREDISHYIEEYDIVIPCMDLATISLSKTDHTGKIVSSEEICNKCLDKVKTYEEWGDIIPPVENTLFPKFFRKRCGFGNKGSGVLNNSKEYNKWSKNHDIHDYVYSNYIKDPFEVSVDCYVSKSGKFVYLSRSRDEVLDGEVVRSSYFELPPEINSKIESILKTPGFFGPINIQLISTKKGWRLLEINPRFCGGMTMTIKSGLDFPGYIIDEMEDIAPFSSFPDIKKLRMCRSRRDHFDEISV